MMWLSRIGDQATANFELDCFFYAWDSSISNLTVSFLNSNVGCFVFVKPVTHWGRWGGFHGRGSGCYKFWIRWWSPCVFFIARLDLTVRFWILSSALLSLLNLYGISVWLQLHEMESHSWTSIPHQKKEYGYA